MPRYRIVKSIDFCYGHRLLEHGGKCRHLHGHNGRVEIVLEGELDAQGMVRDFGEVKDVVGAWIEREFDHRMILQREDPVVPLLEQAAEPLKLIDFPPTAENLARLIYEHAESRALPVREVRFWETPTSQAVYRG